MSVYSQIKRISVCGIFYNVLGEKAIKRQLEFLKGKFYLLGNFVKWEHVLIPFCQRLEKLY